MYDNVDRYDPFTVTRKATNNSTGQHVQFETDPVRRKAFPVPLHPHPFRKRNFGDYHEKVNGSIVNRLDGAFHGC